MLMLDYGRDCWGAGLGRKQINLRGWTYNYKVIEIIAFESLYNALIICASPRNSYIGLCTGILTETQKHRSSGHTGISFPLMVPG